MPKLRLFGKMKEFNERTPLTSAIVMSNKTVKENLFDIQPLFQFLAKLYLVKT